jgi:hypothetical protein
MELFQNPIEKSFVMLFNATSFFVYKDRNIFILIPHIVILWSDISLVLPITIFML